MICASGSVVEYRLAKARVAGSNPVSRSFLFRLCQHNRIFYCISPCHAAEQAVMLACKAVQIYGRTSDIEHEHAVRQCEISLGGLR